MIIGIDANCLIFEKAGVGKYTQNLINNILKIDKDNRYFLYFTFLRHRQKRIKLIKELLLKPKPKNITVRIIPIPARWYEFISGLPIPMRWFYRDKLDVFFAPYASGIPKKFGNDTKIVTTIHDLVFLRFPYHRGKKLSNYYLKRHKIALRNSQKIIAVSRSTKKDLGDLLDVPQNKIKVIYEASDLRFKVLKKKDFPKVQKIVGQYFNPQFKYILSVGTLEPRKNLVKLLEAYSMLPYSLQREYHLVIVGARGWNNQEFYQTLRDLNLKDKIIILGFVKDEDLPYIYNKASIFVFPSLYEGFGLPPLEAMASGVPVVCSRNSSLLEVLGTAGLYVDPQNEFEISETIKTLLSRPKIAAKFSKRGQLQAQKFTWVKTAIETLKVFLDCSNNIDSKGRGK